MPAALAFSNVDHFHADADSRETGRSLLLHGLSMDQREIEATEARKLLRVTEWALLHRTDAVADQTGPDGVLRPASVFSFASMPIVMSGIPVDEWCLGELATTLRLSHGAARGLTEEAVEIRQRLPRFWRKVQAGTCTVWRARLVARHTLHLSDDAAEFVDRQLSPFASSLSKGRIKNLIREANLKLDPDKAAADAAEAGEGRGVWFDFEHTESELPADGTCPTGTSRIEAEVDTPDALAFKDALRAKAEELKILGDESSEQVRMAKAVGILADSQYALDIAATVRAVIEDGAAPRRPNKVRTPLGIERTVHIHLHTSTDVARVQASGLPHAASPVAREAVERWIAELAPGTKVKVTPVIDLNGHHAVDAYEAPDLVRALVDERDHLCAFPYCTNRGRFDVDHIDPYVDLDEGGPPGQTSNQNLAKLCRYHHLLKTHGGWTYKRVSHPDDLHNAGHDDWIDWLDREPASLISVEDRGGPPAAYRWTSPMGHTYLVTGTGTYPLD